MIRDRICMFFGGAISILSAGALVYAGVRLLYVTALFDEPPRLLINDLNLARIFGIALGIGLCLVYYALCVARQVRQINRSGKFGLFTAGMLIVLSGVLLLTAFHDVATELHDLKAAGQLKAGDDELSENIAAILTLHEGMVEGGFWILLIAELLLGLSMWSLFWSGVSPDSHRGPAKPIIAAALMAAVVFSGALLFATICGGYAIESSPPRGNPDIEELANYVHMTLMLAQASFIGLIVHGAAISLISLRFRVQSYW